MNISAAELFNLVSKISSEADQAVQNRSIADLLNEIDDYVDSLGIVSEGGQRSLGRKIHDLVDMIRVKMGLPDSTDNVGD